MSMYQLPPIPRAEGFSAGILLLDFLEPHPPGDTANASTYGFPTLFRTVPGASVDRITRGDPDMEAAVVEAAEQLERDGAKSISSNCGLMIHYQDAVARAVAVPVFLSSLLQVPLALRAAGPAKTVGVLGSFVERISPAVLEKAGVPAGARTVVTSIETAPEFLRLSSQPLDTERFAQRLLEAGMDLKTAHPDLGALVIECASFTSYAAPLQRALGVPVYDFVSLIDLAHYVTHRRDYPGV